MDSPQKEPSQDRSELESLEDSETVVEQGSQLASDSSDSNSAGGDDKSDSPASSNGSPTPPKQPRFTGVRRLLRRFNVYLLLFGLVLVVAVSVIVVAYFQDKDTVKKPGDIGAQSLSPGEVEQLANSDATIGTPKQTLNVQANAVFAGKVLVRSSLEVAGGLNIGGNLSLSGITVSGDSRFETVQVSRDLSVAGNGNIQGSFNVQRSLQVNGGGTFGGALSAPQITTSNLQLNGTLNLNHHITAGGPIPGRSVGGAVGSGGTASVNGSDTAGTVNISTGGGTSAGCFITVHFTQRFNGTPHVVVTPVGASAAGLKYYVNRTTSNFSVCTTSAAPAGRSFAFDYIAFD